ncbi:Uncharacterised protein [Vibrio cincinnatiensis]|uniref:Uncharacterized protein n=1 Tax=Vibrio cincinnatiensis DSM 19608 TaxID=1123491 RepID=A0A1T4RDP0_VIBCI|nr:hypothetical protein [Vibrio cincinnatiensis]SKA13858.1 hypothetical protein SAMN02745782_02554 [Vibrio cincinnatiensis DSM 19608]SUP50017.1 Uncharacterised protein [Vibrio cincinnatiensis]
MMNKKFFENVVLNFASVIISLAVIQLVFQPILYETNQSLYQQFNADFYYVMLLASVLNTMAYNCSITFGKAINNDGLKINTYYYIIAFSLFIACIFIQFAMGVEMVLFSIILYLIDACIGYLRAEKDSFILIFVIIFNSLIATVYFVVFNRPYEAYIVAGSLTLVLFGCYECYFRERLNVYYLKSFNFIKDKGLAILYSGVPTFNRYFDKIIVLFLFSKADVKAILPLIMISGLVSFPLNILSKIAMREKKRSFNFLFDVKYLLVAFLLLMAVLSGIMVMAYFTYGFNLDDKFNWFMALVITLAKFCNVFETLVYSIYKGATDDKSITKHSVFVCLTSAIVMLLASSFGVILPTFFIVLIVIYAAVFPVIQIISLSRK